MLNGRPWIDQTLETELRKAFCLAALGLLTLSLPAQADIIPAPLKPAGWTDLYTLSRDIGVLINGERICHIKYNPGAVQAEVTRIATLLKVSEAKLMREGQLRADEAVPYVTRESCSNFRKMAKREGMSR